MAQVLIRNYAFTWNIQTNNGTLAVQLANNTQGQIPIGDATELFALGDIMRHHSQVVLDEQTQTVVTTFRPAGT